MIAWAGLEDDDRPLACFMLYGPTGSGKTSTVELLAEALHGDHHKYLHVDCATFSHGHEVSSLVGAPPGFTGHTETNPILSAANIVRHKSDKCPYSIILFDEIEKGSIPLWNILLGIMDKGQLRINNNTVTRFEKSIIFMTSNLGLKATAAPSADSNAAHLLAAAAVRDQSPVEATSTDDVRVRFKEVFTPEFINRLDAMIAYKPLGDEEIGKIIDREMDVLTAKVVDKLGVNNENKPELFVLELTPAARTFLIRQTESREYGGREVRRIVKRYVTTPIARMINSKEYPAGGKLTLGVVDKEIVFSRSLATTADLLRASVVTYDWRKRMRGTSDE